MAVFAVVIVPACDEADLGVFWLAAEYLAAFDFQAEPGALGAPGSHRVAVERRLLDGRVVATR